LAQGQYLWAKWPISAIPGPSGRGHVPEGAQYFAEIAMTDHMPLSRYTADYAGQDPLRLAVAAAVDAFAKASIEISDLIGCGALAGITGEAQGAQNADGDVQKDLDVRADEIVRAALKPVSWAALASEEAETADIRERRVARHRL
jgi:fructose-1,6-bisphosphatase